MHPDEILSPTPLPTSDAEPVFVVGSVRSGTSALVNALRKGARIPGFNEGNVASLIQRMLDQVDEHFRKLAPEYLARKDMHLVSRVDVPGLETYIANYLAALYAREMGSGRWVDKSPDSFMFAPMIRSCPLLLRLFPRARFLFCIRRGIENVMSRQRKFPHIPFGYACRSWAHTVEEWVKVKPELQGRGVEVYQRDMAIAPEATGQALQDFLGLDDEQRAGMVEVLRGPRFEQSQAAQEFCELSLDETPWDEGFRAAFIKWCSGAMKQMGFTMEGAGGEGQGEVRLFVPTVEGVIEQVNVPAGGLRACERNGMELTLGREPGPTEVRYVGTVLRGQSRFSARVSLESESTPVRLGVRIEEAETHRRVIEDEKELRGRGPEAWEVELPRGLRGTFDIVISAEPVGAASDREQVTRWTDAILS